MYVVVVVTSRAPRDASELARKLARMQSGAWTKAKNEMGVAMAAAVISQSGGIAQSSRCSCSSCCSSSSVVEWVVVCGQKEQLQLVGRKEELGCCRELGVGTVAAVALLSSRIRKNFSWLQQQQLNLDILVTVVAWCAWRKEEDEEEECSGSGRGGAEG
jgi:hypothetical protein